MDGLERDWSVHLEARGLSARTRDSYLYTLRTLESWCEREALDVVDLKRRHLERFLADVRTDHSPSTAALHYRNLGVFYKWLMDEEEITSDPTLKLAAPHVPVQPVPILTTEDINGLLAVCAGRGFEDRRDKALMLVLLDTGMRVSELVGITDEDIDWATLTLTVLGKGGRRRVVPIGATTGEAMRRYKRVRDKTRSAGSGAFWVGRKDALTVSGVAQLLRRRGAQAGVEGVHPHRFRHTFAHRFLSAGGGEHDLMALAGWRSESMLSRYGASGRVERAIAAGRRFSPVDRL